MLLVPFLIAPIVPSLLNRILSTPARVFLLVTILYLASSFFSATIRPVLPLPDGDLALRYRKNNFAVLSLPRVLRGDEMYYLMMAHSLACDGDLFLSREYTHVLLGGPEMGIYHRRRAADNFFQHFSRDRQFTLLGNHPFGLSALLALLLWPLGGTPWMEPAAIWLTALCGALGILVFIRVLEAIGVPWFRARNAALALAFATPWFSYSRTLYTEVWVGTAFLVILLAILKNRALRALPFACLMGWFKYPALLLVFAAGTGEAIQRRWRNFILMGLAGAATLLAILMFNRTFFRDAGWITPSGELLPSSYSRSILRIAAPIAWKAGDPLHNFKRLFTDFDKGLFPHCPLLLVALAGLVILARRQPRNFYLVLSCALPWTLLHLTYRYLMTGDSYATRYLVPVIPLAVIGLPFFWEWAAVKSLWWRWSAAALLILSLINNVIAGLFPATAFNHAPWEIWYGFWLIIKASAGLATG